LRNKFNESTECLFFGKIQTVLQGYNFFIELLTYMFSFECYNVFNFQIPLDLRAIGFIRSSKPKIIQNYLSKTRLFVPQKYVLFWILKPIISDSIFFISMLPKPVFLNRWAAKLFFILFRTIISYTIIINFYKNPTLLSV
jgi:hypothetical protein